MDRNIINRIFGEWAMHSPDGLASGHTSPENITVLKKILKEHGATESEAIGVVSDVLRESAVETSNETISVEEVVSLLGSAKKVRKEFVEKFRPILIRHPELLRIYNGVPSLADAIKVRNGGIWEGINYSDAFNEIDSIAHKGLGKGELILVYIIKDCVTGGAQSGDLILPDNSTVDVKQLDSAKEILVTLNAIDGYQNLDFVKAMQELKSFLESEPEAEPILLQAFNAERKVSPTSSDVVQESEDLWEDKESATIESFIKNRNTSEIGASVFVGIDTIRKGLSKVAGSNVTPDTVTFSIGKEKKILLISDMEKESLLKSISSLTDKFTKLDFHVSSFKDRNSQYLVPILKGLKMFLTGAGEITLETIHKELIKSLHYNGIVFVDKIGKTMKYLPKSDLEDYSKSLMKFSRLSKGVKFKVEFESIK